MGAAATRLSGRGLPSEMQTHGCRSVGVSNGAGITPNPSSCLSHEIDLLKDAAKENTPPPVGLTPAREAPPAAASLAQHLRLTDETSASPERGAVPKVTRDVAAKPRHPCRTSGLPIAPASLLPRWALPPPSACIPGPGYTPLLPGAPA